MPKKKVINKELLTIAILTLITVLTWIGLDVYRTFKKTTDTSISQKQLEPLESSFDKKTLNSLKERKFISDDELSSVPELRKFELKTEKVEPEENQQATASAEKEETEKEASQSSQVTETE